MPIDQYKLSYATKNDPETSAVLGALPNVVIVLGVIENATRPTQTRSRSGRTGRFP